MNKYDEILAVKHYVDKANPVKGPDPDNPASLKRKPNAGTKTVKRTKSVKK